MLEFILYNVLLRQLSLFLIKDEILFHKMKIAHFPYFFINHVNIFIMKVIKMIVNNDNIVFITALRDFTFFLITPEYFIGIQW